MQFYVRYQERVVTFENNSSFFFGQRKVTEKITDHVMTLEEFQGQFGDELIVEDYLNNVGCWRDNGITDVNGVSDLPLEARIKYIVSETNLQDYLKDHKKTELWNWNGVHPVGMT